MTALQIVYYGWAAVFSLRELINGFKGFFNTVEQEEKKRIQLQKHFEITKAQYEAGFVTDDGADVMRKAKNDRSFHLTLIDLLWMIIGLFTPYKYFFAIIIGLTLSMVKYRTEVRIEYSKYIFVLISLLLGLVSGAIFYLFFSTH